MNRIFPVRLSEHTELVLPLCVASVLALLIVPLPPALLDVGLAMNVIGAALILVATLLAPAAVDLTVFPSVLLLSTLFRLGLNVSTTRLILTKGSAGEMVSAFGHFVVQGDLVVGLVLFLVITLVQFLVIAKGAERVAEVAARFTLDAMPGKQLAIDAALRSGALTEEEAERRRDRLGRESQLFGAMDGAMKFVKGDAIAGLVITAINLVAGFVIGVLRGGLDLAEAAETYSLLTIGDGLIAQLPALLVTIAAGILTTRVTGTQAKERLGDTLRKELLEQPQALALGAGLALVFAAIPGLPMAPFALVGVGLGTAAWRTHRRSTRARLIAASEGPQEGAFKRQLDQKLKQAKAQRAMADQLAPTVRPIEIELSTALSEALGFSRDGGPEPALVRELIPAVRDRVFERMGVPIPAAHVSTFHPRHAADGFVIRLRGVPAVEGKLPLGQLIALEPAERLARLGVKGTRTELPGVSVTAALVPIAERELLEAAGVQTHEAASLLALHLERVLLEHTRSFVGVQEVSELVGRLEKVCPALVKEVVPKLVALPQLVDVLRRLVDEQVSIRDLKSILEVLAEEAAYETDNVLLTERVRVALGRQIAFGQVGALDGALSYVTLDPMIEDAVRGAVVPVQGGHRVALDPEIERAIVESTFRVFEAVATIGVRPVVLAPLELRRYVRVVLARAIPNIVVLSYEELPERIRTTPFGRVSVRAAG